MYSIAPQYGVGIDSITNRGITLVSDLVLVALYPNAS